MKLSASKTESGLAGTHKIKSRKARFPGGKVLADHIATAAYYRAQARGFEPGREIQDWLDAEAELLKHDARSSVPTP